MWPRGWQTPAVIGHVLQLDVLQTELATHGSVVRVPASLATGGASRAVCLELG